MTKARQLKSYTRLGRFEGLKGNGVLIRWFSSPRMSHYTKAPTKLRSARVGQTVHAEVLLNGQLIANSICLSARLRSDEEMLADPKLRNRLAKNMEKVPIGSWPKVDAPKP